MIKGTESYIVSLNPDSSQDVTIGNYTSIGNNVLFMGQMNHANIGHREAVSTFPFNGRWPGVTNYYENYSKGPITIGNDVWIGRDVMILDGVTIGDGAIIGARTVVSKNVTPFAVVVGNPGVVKKYRFTSFQIIALQKIEWWKWDVNTVKQRIEDMKDINIFIKKYL